MLRPTFAFPYVSNYVKVDQNKIREVAEWSNAAVLKTVVPQGTGGSNPSFSAKEKPDA